MTHWFELERVTLVPEGSVGWERELLSQDHRIRGARDGTPFAVRPGEPHDDAAFLGLGVTALWTQRLSTYLRYDGPYHGDSDAHAFTGGFALRF